MKWNELNWMDSEPVEEELVVRVETFFGVKFPNSYKDCIMTCDGGTPEECVFLHKRHDEEEHEDALGILLSINKMHHTNIYDTYEGLGNDFLKGIVPIADNGCGDYICFDFRNGSAKIIFFAHEDDEIYSLAESFDDFINLLHLP